MDMKCPNNNIVPRMKKSYSVILMVCLFLFIRSISAQIFFEDSKGENILIHYMGSSISFNTSNNSIKAGFRLKSSKSWCFGFDISGKATNGISTLLKGGNINPGVKINVNIGYVLQETQSHFIKDKIHKRINLEKYKEIDKIDKFYGEKIRPLKEKIQKTKRPKEKNELERKLNNLNKEKKAELKKINKKMTKKLLDAHAIELPKQRNWINLRLGYERAKFKIFSPDASFEDQLSDELFDGFSAQFSFNSFLRYYNILVSFAVGISNTNNASELKKVELTDEIIYGNSGQITRLGRKTITARQGKFEKFNKGNLLLSGFWKPSALPFGLVAYGRYNYSRLIRSLNLGMGAYIVKPTNALIPLGGILVEYEDKFNSEMEDISFGDRFTISLVVNLPFLIAK